MGFATPTNRQIWICIYMRSGFFSTAADFPDAPSFASSTVNSARFQTGLRTVFAVFGTFFSGLVQIVLNILLLYRMLLFGRDAEGNRILVASRDNKQIRVPSRKPYTLD
jgi:hypothetical protein